MLMLLLIMAIPLGRYIAKVYKGERVWTDFLSPFERLLYRLGGINPVEEMTWQRFLRALLTINMLWLVYGFIMLFYQGILPLNPDGNPSMTPDLTFNTVISFVVNCNLQHYSGESGLTYLSQIGVVMYFQFVSAAAGMAALAGVYKAMQEKQIQHHWQFLRVLHPKHYPDFIAHVDCTGIGTGTGRMWHADDL